MTVEAALSRLQRGDPDGALSLLDQAGDGAAVHAARGMALLAADRAEAARAALRAAVALGDTAPVTVLNLALAEERTGDRARGRTLMLALAERLPDWDEPLLRLAESHRAAREQEAAEAAYQATLDRNPRRTEAMIALAGLLISRGVVADARALLLRCLGRDPDQPEAWDALGLSLMQGGEASLALTAFTEAQRLAPHRLDYALHGVDAAAAADLSEAEEARLSVACRQDPVNPVLFTAHAVLLERLGRRDAAIDALTIATALAPDARLPALLLGGILARSNRLREAEAALRRAQALDPDNPQAGNDFAAVLMRMHRHAEARDLLLTHIETFGEQVPALCNLANATVCMGYQRDAVAFARRAIAVRPDAVLPRRALCNTLPYLDGVDGAALLAALRDCGVRLPRAPMPPFGNDRDPDRRLTIGLLSGTLKTHPVGWMTVAGIETLDPERFDVVCLAQNAVPTDPIARRFRAAARAWIDVDTLGDEAVSRLARAQGIDVLIDLGGYGDAARMNACAYRLAPVQVKWVGMQNHSTGLAEMDWFLTDRWETPDGFETLYSERLLRLPDGYVCYSPPPYAPDVVTLPALANGFVTFGCFNNLAKITPSVLAAWRAILDRLPTARLVLKTHQFSDAATARRIRAAFGSAGDRVETRGSSGHRAFMGEYNQIDIALDPFPYSGGLTTIEALWMGVPTVMLPGEIFAARHSFSHMSNAGLTGWAAGDADAYVALAVRQAGDLPRLAALRAGLRGQVKASPLCDAPRFGRNLGAALRHAWRDWCFAQDHAA
jgi:predicted O-linked N-acetylglucosamine transferase (SPINDLY family)